MGFSSHGAKSLKANRALLKKRRSFNDLRKEYEGYVGNTKVSFKQLTTFEQKKLKDKIRNQARTDRKKELLAYVLAFILVLSFLTGLYY